MDCTCTIHCCISFTHSQMKACMFTNRGDCWTFVWESKRVEKWPFSDKWWQKYLGKLGSAARYRWCLSNPANRIRRDDRGGRLAAVYNAGMDLRLSKGLQEALWRRWGSLGWSAGIYILPAWTYGLALQINIQRHLILPSVKWQRAGRVMWIKDDRVVEIKHEAFIKTSVF